MIKFIIACSTLLNLRVIIVLNSAQCIFIEKMIEYITLSKNIDKGKIFLFSPTTIFFLGKNVVCTIYVW